MTFPFIHESLPRHELRSETGAGGRYYSTPIGKLPSVTTVIGRALDKSGLVKWRERIGKEAANQIIKQAGIRGRAVHDICEHYVMNDLDYRKGVMPTNLDTFLQIKPLLDASLQTVYGIELPLWSSYLNTSGTADIVAKWNGTNAIIDYKTALRPKKEEYCLSYFLQATAYSMMVEERYDILIPTIVVILAIDHEAPVVYVKKRTIHEDQVVDIFVNQRKYDEVI